MAAHIEGEHPGEREHRLSEVRKGLQDLFPASGEMKHLASGSAGDVFVSGEGKEKVVYKVRQITARVRPGYWEKEALVLHLLSKSKMAPKLLIFLPDTKKGALQANQRMLNMDTQTIQVLKAGLDEEALRSFQDVTLARGESVPVETGVICMEYVENDVSAYKELKEANPEEIDRQLKEIATFLRMHELYPSDVELVFDGSDGRLKFRDVGGFRVCRLKEGDWNETDEMGMPLEERLQDLLVSLERF